MNLPTRLIAPIVEAYQPDLPADGEVDHMMLLAIARGGVSEVQTGVVES